MARKVDIDDKLILDTAKELFFQQGIRKTEMLDIARRVNIGRSSLYRHFDSKEAIAFQIAMEVLNKIDLPLTESLPREWNGFQRLEACLKDFVENLIRCAAEVRFLDEFDQVFTDPYPDSSMAKRYTEYNRQSPQPLEEYLREGAADGSIRSLENPDLVGKAITNALMGTAQRVLPREDHLRTEQGYGREYLSAVLELLLRSLHP